MGEKTAVYGGRKHTCCLVSAGARVDQGDCGVLPGKIECGRFFEYVKNRRMLLKRGQNASWTIFLAVLSIYAVDFAINAGTKCVSSCKATLLTDR